MRVEPPTSTTSSIFAGFDAGVGRAPACVGPTVRCSRSSTSCSNLARRQPHAAGASGRWLSARDERQVDVGLHHRGELHLGLLRRLPEPLQRHPVLAEIDPLALLELRDDPLDDALIEVVAAEVRVAVGGLHLDHALADLEDRDVEGAAAEVVDGDRLVLLLVEAVGQRRRRRLVDDPHHLEAGNRARFLGGLPLRVVEVGGNRDDGARDRLAQVLLGGLLQLLRAPSPRSPAARSPCPPI